MKYSAVVQIVAVLILLIVATGGAKADSIGAGDTLTVDMENGGYILVPGLFNFTSFNITPGQLQITLNASNLTWRTATNKTLTNIVLNSATDTYSFNTSGTSGYLNFSATMANASSNYSFYLDNILQGHANTTGDKIVTFNYSGAWSDHEFKINYTVAGASPPAAEPTYIPPEPICTTTNGTSWINVSCSAGAGNVTNGMNFTNTNTSAWSNGSAVIWNNTGLSAGTYYVYHVFAWNSSGTGTLSPTYATITNTTTPAAAVPESLDVINTLSASGITTGEVTLNGNTTNVSGSAIVWFEYSGNPSSYIYKTSNQTISGNVSFSSKIKGTPLMSGKTYYYKASGSYNNVEYDGTQKSFTMLTLDPTDYNFDQHFTNLTDSELNITKMSAVGASPYTDILGSIFWGILFAVIFIMIWLRQEDITIPALLGLIIGASLWASMPSDWTSMAMSLTVVSFAGLVFSLIKGRN